MVHYQLHVVHSSIIFTSNDYAIVSLEDVHLPERLSPNQVHVQMLLAPINPADINQIEGSYAFIPPIPFVAGNEGLGQVLSVGSSVKNFKAGDWVLPAPAGMGTWCQQLVCQSDQLISIPKDIPPEAAATILVNPCTAYRMLEDFVDLRPGDCVMQNGANSSVGRALIQIAAMKGIRTVNIVRDRPNHEELEKDLLSIGASMVIKADRLILPETQAHIKSTLGCQPVLALNCVGGQAATDLARSLAPGGALVNYGGMSKRPVTIPTGLLIFNDIRIHGFWISAWYKRQVDELKTGQSGPLTSKRESMMQTLFTMIRSGKLRPAPSRAHPLKTWRTALEKAMEPYTGTKEMFKLTEY